MRRSHNQCFSHRGGGGTRTILAFSSAVNRGLSRDRKIVMRLLVASSVSRGPSSASLGLRKRITLVPLLLRKPHQFCLLRGCGHPSWNLQLRLPEKVNMPRPMLWGLSAVAMPGFNLYRYDQPHHHRHEALNGLADRNYNAHAVKRCR